MDEINDQEELERINKEIEAELEKGIIPDDEEEADDVSNRHVNFLMVIAIAFALAIAINVGIILFRVVKLFL